MLRIESRRDQRRPDRPGSNAIDTDSSLGQGNRQRAGKSNDSPLRSRIINQMAATTVSGNRGRVNDHSAVPKMRNSCLGENEINKEVGLKCLQHLIQGDILEGGLHMLLACIIDQYIQAP